VADLIWLGFCILGVFQTLHAYGVRFLNPIIIITL
jgi:hypothetical protein